MIESFDPGALLATAYALPGGARVRLRLPGRRDAPALRDLLSAQGDEAGALELARWLHHHPRRRIVLCALRLDGGRERLAGIGAVDVASAASPQVVADDAEVADLLAGALLGRARALVRARAA